MLCFLTELHASLPHLRDVVADDMNLPRKVSCAHGVAAKASQKLRGLDGDVDSLCAKHFRLSFRAFVPSLSWPIVNFFPSGLEHTRVCNYSVKTDPKWGPKFPMKMDIYIDRIVVVESKFGFFCISPGLAVGGRRCFRMWGRRYVPAEKTLPFRSLSPRLSRAWLGKSIVCI